MVKANDVLGDALAAGSFGLYDTNVPQREA